MQRWYFPKCQCQNSTALYLWRHRLMRNLILWAIPSSRVILISPRQMTTASQMLCRCQRTVTLLCKVGLLTWLTRGRQLSLLSQLVQANVVEFAQFHKEWQNSCPNGISMETKVCTRWHLKLLLAIQMKTSSTMPIFNFKSEWETLSHSMQKWWVTLCIFNKR